jgi:hypothetical protein
MDNLEAIAAVFQVDPEKLRGAVPEYLWFVLAVAGIFLIGYILHRLVNYLITAIGEIRKATNENTLAIKVIHETLKSVKDMLNAHEDDIRELRNAPRKRGQ